MGHIKPDDYDKALQAQSACNLSGVVFSFAEIMQRICDQGREEGHGSDWRNKHPICRLFAEQIAHLSGAGTPMSTIAPSYSKAYDACLAGATEETRNAIKEGRG